MDDHSKGGLETVMLDGRALARSLNATLIAPAAALDRPPGLAVVLVGEDEASARYVRQKGVVAGRLGFEHQQIALPTDVSQDRLQATIQALVDDPAVHGVLLQLPLPEYLDAQAALACIPPHKDVDCLHPENVGRVTLGTAELLPCTAWGVIELIRSTGRALSGAEAVVVGRSALVGRPTSLLLDQAGATVTVCHRSTRDLELCVRRAEVLVVAAGVPGLVRGTWVRPGAVVIDVGIHSTEHGLVGDVEASSALGRAAFLSPVPGGVGPLTIAGLMRNTFVAARAQQRAR